MKVSVEEQSGFCFGVRKAIDLAEKLLEQGEEVYCLGEIVHNEKEVKRLKEKGLVFIEYEDLVSLKNKTVLFRAHGEPPEIYEIARKNNLRIVDGTCPIVLNLQKKIGKKAIENPEGEARIVIYGKEGHPEVEGLKGHSGNRAIIVRDIEDLEKLPENEKLILFSQTTMDTKGFQEISEKLKTGRNNPAPEIYNTICRHISHREPGLRKFARANEVVVFVSGKKSSNGKILYDICRSENSLTYFVSGVDEVKSEWFSGVRSAGVSGATSTPVWLLDQVAKRITSFTKT